MGATQIHKEQNDLRLNNHGHSCLGSYKSAERTNQLREIVGIQAPKGNVCGMGFSNIMELLVLCLCTTGAAWEMALFAGSTASNKDALGHVDLGRRRLILEPQDGHPVGLVIL